MDIVKGQIKPKAVWARLKYSQKTNEWKMKQILFIRFFGESMERPNCFRFYLTFSSKSKNAKDIELLPQIILESLSEGVQTNRKQTKNCFVFQKIS